MGLRHKVGAGVVSVLLLAAGGYLAADAADVVPGPLTARAPGPAPSPFPTISLPAPSPAPTLGSKPTPSGKDPASDAIGRLAEKVFGADGGAGLASVGLSVTDLGSGKTIYSLRGDSPYTPASTTKLFTAAAAIDQLGPDFRATTQVVTGASASQIVLVGGGDAMLSPGAGNKKEVSGRAGLGDLAKATAKALKAQGTTSVTLALDDTLFEGPAFAPTWEPGYMWAGNIAPVQPIAVDGGRTKKGAPTMRVEDPAMTAAETFAAQLRRQGIKVGAPARGQAPAGARQIAAVRAAPNTEVVGYMLQHSDNYVAEALGKLVAHQRGKPTTYAGAAAAISQTAKEIGADTTGLALLDCSGLTEDSKLRPANLTSLLTAIYADPELGPVFAGLPVAHLDGTLTKRFASADSSVGAGLVRAKTGTHERLHALSGIAQDADGRTLAFAAIVHEPKDEVLKVSSEDLLDEFAAGLAACGCAS